MKGELKNEIQNTTKSQQNTLMSQNNAFQNTLQNNLQNMLSGFFQAQASPSGTLPSNTVPNPKVERETEETTDKEQTNFQGSSAQIPPLVIPISIPEPDVPKSLPKTNSILDPNSNFADALLLMPRFAPTIKSFSLNNGKVLELAKITLEQELPRQCSSKLSENLEIRQNQTTRYSSTNDKSVNRIDIIDAVCEEYALKLLGFPNSSGGNPTLTSEPFTSEFILEEIEAYLKDDSISLEIDHADCNPEEDICLIEKLLNNDPFQLPPMDLKQSEVTEAKPSIEEPPELELKDLPSHLEYVFLEENNKLPVIIAKVHRFSPGAWCSIELEELPLLLMKKMN
ncbi:hypothetical protein Tco_1053216 [Tanacetum coccineum]